MGVDDRSIVIRDSELIGRRLNSSVSVPRRLRKYLRSSSLFLNYDSEIAADKSILNIPMLTTLLPLAWLTGSDISVGELDATFVKSLHRLQQFFSKMYPELPFTTEINVKKLVENDFEVDPTGRTALLFSGGVDSTFSAITNIGLRPKLIIIWGVSGYPYPKHHEYWENVLLTYLEFSKRHFLPLHLIRTNALEVLHSMRIEHDFHKELLDGPLWLRLQYALFMLPLTAPLSIGRFDRLLMASARHPTYDFLKNPEAMEPIAREIKWANLKIHLDGFIPRIDKIAGAIRQYHEVNQLKLRVCQRHRLIARGKLNCCSCEKCYRTIIPLILSRMDPNECGFETNFSTFKKMRSFFEEKKMSSQHIEDQWKPIQKHIPDKIEYDIYGSKEFLKWLREFNFKSMEKDESAFKGLYYNLPWYVSKVLFEIHKIKGTNLH